MRSCSFGGGTFIHPHSTLCASINTTFSCSFARSSGYAYTLSTRTSSTRTGSTGSTCTGSTRISTVWLCATARETGKQLAEATELAIVSKCVRISITIVPANNSTRVRYFLLRNETMRLEEDVSGRGRDVREISETEER